VIAGVFLFGRTKHVFLFSIIFVYYLSIQAANFAMKKRLIFIRSFMANAASVIFPFLVFSLLYLEIPYLAYAYYFFMIYSLTEKLFVSLKKEMNALFYLIIISFVSVAIFLASRSDTACFENKCITLEIVDSYEERAIGLMYRSSIDEGRGMLFIFEEPGYHQFYMKNMKMPIDMIFLDENLTITKIFSEVSTCIEAPCELYSADTPTKYVIETKAGFSKKHGVEPGQKVALKRANIL
jgi:uncharacterized protein